MNKRKSFILTGKTPKGEKVVRLMYHNKDGKNRSKVRHELISEQPFSFRSIITDRNLLKKPQSEQFFREMMNLTFRASGCTDDDYEMECELD